MDILGKLDARGKAMEAEKRDDPAGVYYCSKNDRKHDIFGFVNVKGDYIPSAFIRAYTGGMHFKFYDYDQVKPVVTMRVNHALISGYIDLPDGVRVHKHKNFKLTGGVSRPLPQQLELTPKYMEEITEALKNGDTK